MTGSVKNAFVLVNRIPPEVMYLISDYFSTEKELIKSTHVCRRWREIFISRASLWTFLDCTNRDKTNVYIQRSRDSPLDVSVFAPKHMCRYGGFELTLPLISRFKTLALSGSSRNVSGLTRHLGSPAPLLEKLDIQAHSSSPVFFESNIFGGNLSSLRELRLHWVFTNLPWRDMINLTRFDFHPSPGVSVSVTQLLDFFEHAPLLREIKLVDSLPHSSNAPAERVMPLPHLSMLKIRARSEHSILLNHLHIPIGASVTMEFQFNFWDTPVLDYFPKSLDNLSNISHITSLNLNFGSGVAMRLQGPSGCLYALGELDCFPRMSDCHLLQSLNELPISSAERLTVTFYRLEDPETGEPAAYRTLLLMNRLRTLTLAHCDSEISFISALNPNCNASGAVLCPELEELVLYIRRDCIKELLEMAKGRASRGANLSSILVFHPYENTWPVEMFSLKNYVSHVEYGVDWIEPSWDILPGEDDDKRDKYE